jgi:hypothetical protein
VLDTAAGDDPRLAGHLVEARSHGFTAVIEHRRSNGRGADVDRDHHAGYKITAMSERWEILTLRALASTDERAEEFTGTLVIHREGSLEPVESVAITVKRSMLAELHETVGRLLTRSTAFPGRGSTPRPTSR